MKLITHFSILSVTIFSLWKLDRTTALYGQDVEKVVPYDLPFIASLSKDDQRKSSVKSHFCTGVLISDQMVLTAKHCAVYLDKFQVVIRIGCPSLQFCRKYHWEKWTSYENWATKNNRVVDPNNDDIAVIKLEEKVSIQPATLVSAPKRLKDGSTVYMAGWGDLDDGSLPDYLRQVSVKILSKEDCEERTVGSVPRGYFNWNRKICTVTDSESGYAILGYGDSGGPLFDTKNRVIGINIGASPPTKPKAEQVNDHCTIHFYRDFIHSFLQ